MALVIKQWRANDEPDEDGVYVFIKGREEGVIAFLFSLVGIDPVTSLGCDLGTMLEWVICLVREDFQPLMPL